MKEQVIIMNNELIFRNENGDFLDCIRTNELKELVNTEKEIFLSSFFEDNLTVKITKFKGEFFIKVEAFPIEIFKRFPNKRINKLIQSLRIDTIQIS